MREDRTTRAIYDFIRRYVSEHGYAPSLREMARGCYIAQGTLIRHLDKLEAWGWIIRDAGRARSIVVVDREKAAWPEDS